MTTQKNAGILSPVGKRLSCALTLMLTLAALLLPSSAKAGKAWVEYNSSNTTLTFKYGTAKPSSDETVTVYDLNEGGNSPGWEGKTCTSVVFDESFSKARPTTCANWFISQKTLTSITGLKYLNTERVTNMSGMFRYCTSLKSLDLTTFNTANVTDMNAMFIGCTSLESLDVSSFNTEKVTSMFYMFNGCTALKKLDLSSFNTKKVTDMSYMFLNCTALESLNISKFNTKSVTDMSHMFEYCKVLKNLDVSNFNTENVKTMRCMFSGCEALESLDLTDLDTKNVTDMSYMFDGCLKLVTIFVSDKFSTAKVGSSAGMFADCTVLEGAVKYDKDKTNVAMANSETGYFYQKKAWVEYDSSKQTLTFKYGKKPSDTETVKAYDLNEGGSSPGWEDKTCTSVVFDESFSQARPTTCAVWFIGQRSLTSIKGLEYLNTEKVTNMNGMFRYCTSLKSLDLTTFNTENVTDMGAMFIGCTSLESVDVSSFNTEKVTDMRYMFYNCEALKLLDLSNFNTKNVAYMHEMFGFSPNLATIFASDKFTIANLSEYYEHEMFEACASLVGAVAYDGLWRTDHFMANLIDGYFSLKKAWAEYDSDKKTLTFKYGKKPSSTETVTVYDLNEGRTSPGWHDNDYTSVVFDESFSKARPTTCYEWFDSRSSLTSITDLKYLNTEEVTDMNSMFNGCSGLGSLDLSNFNTEKVTSMFYMFNGCTALQKLDLSSFNTKKVTEMNYMFQNCTALESLNISKFNTESVTDMGHMFEDCKVLKNLDVSNFNTENVESMSCMFSCCEVLESLDLADFDTKNVTDMSYMFAGCPKLVNIFGSDKFSTAKVRNSAGMFADCTVLEGAVKYDKDKTDASMANSETGYFYQKKMWTEYDNSKQTLTFKYGKKPSSSDGTVTLYDLNEGSNSPEWEDLACTSVVFDESFSKARPTTCYRWFIGQKTLTSITGLEYLNTEKVTNMQRMFSYCEALKSLDLSTFNTANVTDMHSMFSFCSVESLDVSSFNTEKVTDMGYMFYSCEALKLLDLSSFNTKNVTLMQVMFSYCESLTTIFASDKFSIANLTEYADQTMFTACYSLVGAVAFSDSEREDHYMANYNDGYFRTYYKVGDTKTELYGKTLSVDELELTDDKDLEIRAPFTAANVSYLRPMTNKWGTLCVPFEVDATSNTGYKFYALKSVSADMITLTQLEDKIPAGTPMLVNLTDGDGNATSISISASSVTVGTTPADGTQADGWQLVGSFAETEVPDDGYIISKDKFWLVSDLKDNISGAKSVKTKPMRAWLKPGTESAEAKAHVLSIAIDDENETTAVDAIEALTEEGTTEIFDLQGRRLNSLQKGLNIVKTGKVTRKIMVK